MNTLEPGLHDFALPDGRTLHLLVMDLRGNHTCVDVYTTRGRDHEQISTQTGDATRAPMGMFAWRNGQRFKIEADADPDSHEWPAVSCVSLLWDQNEDGSTR
jgi:hypothetical protein